MKRKRKIRAYARRAYAAGKSFASGLKTDALAGGGGAAVAMVEQHFLTPAEGEEGFFADHWWAKGGLMAVVGLLVRRYMPMGGMGTPLAYGVLGAAGYMLVKDYYAQPEDTPEENSAGVWGRRPYRGMQNAAAIASETFYPQMQEARGVWGADALESQAALYA